MKKKILIFLILLCVPCFTAKVTDYVSKEDIDNSKKIFINKESKKQYQEQSSQISQQSNQKNEVYDNKVEEITIKMTFISFSKI